MKLIGIIEVYPCSKLYVALVFLGIAFSVFFFKYTRSIPHTLLQQLLIWDEIKLFIQLLGRN